MLLTRLRRFGMTALFLAGFSSLAAGQIPIKIPGTEPPKSEATTAQPVDPLQRTSPRSALTAFVKVVDRGDFPLASRYMQLTSEQRENTETLAHDLKELMDRYLKKPIISISDSPGGALDDGLAVNEERIGPLVVGDKKADIMMVRVVGADSGPIWLISSETLDQVPELYDSIALSWVERTMPAPLLSRSVFGLSLALWILLFASLAIPFVLLALASLILFIQGKRALREPEHKKELEAWHKGLRWPLIVALTLTIHLMLMQFFGVPLSFRITYSHIGRIALVIAFTWLARRLLTLGFSHARAMATGNRSTQSLMLLGERLAKAIIVVIAIMAILVMVGVDTSTALAGLGIGGVALALGGQKTVENLLGGIFLLTDKALAVGDLCSISNRLGWVEDITLRSVRLRTLDQTLVSVPAGILAQAGIENFATRQKILVQSTLGLKYGTTTKQLRQILAGIRESLDANPKIEANARIRLVNFGQRAVELELFAYVLTMEPAEFFAVREAVLLDIAGIVEAAGSGFAMPTQFVYMDSQTEASTEKALAQAGGAVETSKAR